MPIAVLKYLLLRGQLDPARHSDRDWWAGERVISMTQSLWTGTVGFGLMKWDDTETRFSHDLETSPTILDLLSVNEDRQKAKEYTRDRVPREMKVETFRMIRIKDERRNATVSIARCEPWQSKAAQAVCVKRI